jgi:2,5-diamino-6-(ribosylamino)-4(3H)-pyrimidinone 5'-phosphate reductase
VTTATTSRPFVILNPAMSLDGKIATFTGDSRMSSLADMRRVHRLRASVDAIMVGLRTLLRDDPKLTVRFFKSHEPFRIIVDSNALSPPSSYVVRTAREIPTIIAVTSKAPQKRVEALKRKGVRVITCGSGPLVSLRVLLKRLRKLGIRRLLLEGGGTLNWSMLNNRLVDKISVAITPRILGGSEATSLVEGRGNALVRDGVQMRLLSHERYGSDLVVRYKVLHSDRMD